MKHLLKPLLSIIRNPKRNYKGHTGGAWDEEAHRVLYGDNFNEGLARHICQQFAPTSYLEFGSGLGHLAQYIAQHTEADPIHCIEPNGIKGAYNELRPKLFPVDIFTQNTPEELKQKYDLVLSIEVAEHIDRKYHDQLFDTLCSLCSKWMIFSAARPGQAAEQGGHGHIAERPEEEWKSELLSRGLIFEPNKTQEIRATCDTKNINHRRNLMVFRIPDR